MDYLCFSKNLKRYALLPYFLAAAVFATSISEAADAQSPAPVENPGLAKLFKAQAVQGTFVLLDLESGSITTHNSERARTRLVPASTFKIPNTLIALETGAVSGLDEVFPYDGKPRFLKDWEQDLTLRQAFRLSAVPVYQEVARRIGLPEMQKWLKRLDYGNAETGETVDTFWLEGPLKISAIEQIQFLARLLRGELPCKKETVEKIKEISLFESGNGYTLHAKTGWQMAGDPEIGWFVGWVNRDGRQSAFALNIDIEEKADGEKRIPLAKECLILLGVLPVGP